jgi:nucleoid-associated protein YgaU
MANGNGKNKKSSSENTFTEIFNDKSTTSVVVATVILLLLSFFAFRYFGNSAQYDSDQLNGDGASDIVLESGGETQDINISEEQEQDLLALQDSAEEVVQEVEQVAEQAVEEAQEVAQEVSEEVQQISEEAQEEMAEDSQESEPQEQEQANEQDQAQNEESTEVAEAETEESGDNRGFFARLFGRGGSDNSEETADNGDSEEGDVAGEEQVGEVVVEGEDETTYVEWVAKDYQANSLQGITHNVQSGDTLWEIAEAYYGNGADWVKIANANGVGYNVNGHPLIYAGTTITIP